MSGPLTSNASATKKRPKRLSMPASHVAAVRRVLKLADGYASTERQHVLMAFEGGVMTWAEIREHIQAAIALLPRNKRK